MGQSEVAAFLTPAQKPLNTGRNQNTVLLCTVLCRSYSLLCCMGSPEKWESTGRACATSPCIPKDLVAWPREAKITPVCHTSSLQHTEASAPSFVTRDKAMPSLLLSTLLHMQQPQSSISTLTTTGHSPQSQERCCTVFGPCPAYSSLILMPCWPLLMALTYRGLQMFSCFAWCCAAGTVLAGTAWLFCSGAHPSLNLHSRELAEISFSSE